MHSSRSLIKFTSLLKLTNTLKNDLSTLSGTANMMQVPVLPVIQQQFHHEIQQNISILPEQMNQKVNTLNLSYPKIICHRGRCDIFPENTIESITEGMLTADLVQFDVMLTKDEEVIVFHDRYLGQITNIAQHQCFSNRKTINDLNLFGQIPHSEWWTKQFTLQELKKLSVKQKHVTRPQLNIKKYEIPTLEEVLTKCLQIKLQNPNNKAGILIEIKTQRENYQASQNDKILLQKINQILTKFNINTEENCKKINFPIIIQSFNHEAIQIFHNNAPLLPLAHLYHEEDEKVSEHYVAAHRTKKSIGVAISTKHLTNDFIEACHRMKYEIFYWSVRDDHPQIPLGCGSYQELYQRLTSMKLDGIITDFAHNCKLAIKGLVG